MDKATISAVMGTVLGLCAGVAGMMLFAVPKQDSAEMAQMESRIGDLNDTLRQYGEEHERLREELEREKRKATAGGDFAAELERAAAARSEAEARARESKESYESLKSESAESLRQQEARIRELERILERNGIVEHLSDEVIAERIEKFNNDFRTGMAANDKKRVLDALWAMQKLGPRAYDDVIAMWREVTNDYGLMPPGAGENKLGLNFQDFTNLISDFGLIEYALTDSGVADDFRIAAIFGMPWWSEHDAGYRTRLVGNALLGSSGYESVAAIQSLRDIDDPGTVRYLAEYLGVNRDNPSARRQAIGVLAAKGTPDAWDAIRDTAANDPDEAVRKAAQDAIDANTAVASGIRVTFVSPDGQAALAGIMVGDIVTHYNGVKVGTIAEIVAERDKLEGAESVQVRLYRGTDEITITLGPGQIGINGVAVKAAE